MNGAAVRAYPYTPDEVLPPGATLAEVLDSLAMTQTDLARRTGLSVKHINQIVNGAASITPDTALLLERATRVSARVWNALEMAYRESVSRRDEENAFAADIGWLDELPVRQLIARGVLTKGTSPADQVRRVCGFFGVANHAAYEALWHKPTMYRRSKVFTSDPGAVAAWLRIGEMRASDIECAEFDRTYLMNAVTEGRRLTRERDPDKWEPALKSLCAGAGVAVVFEPELKKARINGAARWLSPTKALLQLSLRHRWSDIFWFTFFHEVGHLLIHSKKETFLNDPGPHSGVEQEADAFAAQTLIPREFEADLSGLETPDQVEEFANRLEISPGIVVGRLQYEGRWPYSMGNDLKQRFVIRAASRA